MRYELPLMVVMLCYRQWDAAIEVWDAHLQKPTVCGLVAFGPMMEGLRYYRKRFGK